MVLGLRPKAAAPPPVVGRSSVSGSHCVDDEFQFFVRHKPPPEVRKNTTSGLVGCGRMLRARPLSRTWPVKLPFCSKSAPVGPMLTQVRPALFFLSECPLP